MCVSPSFSNGINPDPNTQNGGLWFAARVLGCSHHPKGASEGRGFLHVLVRECRVLTCPSEITRHSSGDNIGKLRVMTGPEYSSLLVLAPYLPNPAGMWRALQAANIRFLGFVSSSVANAVVKSELLETRVRGFLPNELDTKPST
jgi:hypothetical protein